MCNTVYVVYVGAGARFVGDQFNAILEIDTTDYDLRDVDARTIDFWSRYH